MQNNDKCVAWSELMTAVRTVKKNQAADIGAGQKVKEVDTVVTQSASRLVDSGDFPVLEKPGKAKKKLASAGKGSASVLKGKWSKGSSATVMVPGVGTADALLSKAGTPTSRRAFSSAGSEGRSPSCKTTLSLGSLSVIHASDSAPEKFDVAAWLLLVVSGAQPGRELRTVLTLVAAVFCCNDCRVLC